MSWVSAGKVNPYELLNGVPHYNQLKWMPEPHVVRWRLPPGMSLGSINLATSASSLREVPLVLAGIDGPEFKMRLTGYELQPSFSSHGGPLSIVLELELVPVGNVTGEDIAKLFLGEAVQDYEDPIDDDEDEDELILHLDAEDQFLTCPDPF